MTTIFVARSVRLSKWGSDVGVSKHLFKLGVTEEPAKAAVAGGGWAGETDWALLRQREAEVLDEAEIIERLQRKTRMIDPKLYPKLKGATGIFRVPPEHVENHILMTRALAGESERAELKLKPADFADYLINNALR